MSDTPLPSPKSNAEETSEGSTLSDWVQTGRKREVYRTFAMMVALHLVQIPLFLVAVGHWDSAIDPGAVVPWRLLIAIDLGIILARLFVAYRAWGLLQSRRPRRPFLQWGLGAIFVVAVASFINFIGDVATWYLADYVPGTAPGWLQALSDWCYRPGQVVSVVAMVVLLAMAFRRDITAPIYRAVAEAEAEKSGTEGTELEVTAAEAAGGITSVDDSAEEDQYPRDGANKDIVICCSGGGIRASAFSLGGLQVLQEEGIYQQASAVIGVSGGGYTAAGHHVLRWNVHRQNDERPGRDAPRRLRESVIGDWNLEPGWLHAFAPMSPELHWLRRHTRYILDSAGTLIHAVLSLAFGIAVNIVLIAVGIGALGWLLGWLFLASGRLSTGTVQFSGDGNGVVARFGEPWAPQWDWVLPVLCFAPLVVGVGAFALEKLIDRFTTVWVGFRRLLRSTAKAGVYLAAAMTALLIAAPWVVQVVAEWTAGSASLPAWVIHHAGVVPDNVCAEVLRANGSACGAGAGDSVRASPLSSALTVNTVSITAVVSSVLAVLASLSKQVPSQSAEGNLFSRVLAKMWAKVKDPLVPYAAVTVLGVVAAVSLLRTVSLVVMDGTTIKDWRTGLILAAALIVVRVFTEPNRTSMHQFFRERISDAFFVYRPSARRAEPIDYRRPLRFSEAGPGSRGPRLVACAVANVTDSTLIPSKRSCTPFVFDDARMGLTERMLEKRYARRSSAAYEFAADEYYRDATIPAAVAMSAAAFSPLAGRENVRIAPYRVVLALGNARLGVWLPNPLWVDEVAMVKRLISLGRYDEARALLATLPWRDRAYLVQTSVSGAAFVRQGTQFTPSPLRRHWARVLKFVGPVRGVFKKPGLFSLIKEAFGRASIYDRFLYVTDGGHYDNLGLMEALRRQPDTIFVLDASNDPEDTFRALGQAMATAQMDLGCDIRIDPRVMRRLEQQQSRVAWCTGTCRYADGSSGAIHVVKAVVTGDAPWDIEGYASAHADFPRTSTGRQLYSEFDFEAYRALGEHAVRRLLEGIPAVTR